MDATFDHCTVHSFALKKIPNFPTNSQAPLRQLISTCCLRERKLLAWMGLLDMLVNITTKIRPVGVYTMRVVSAELLHYCSIKECDWEQDKRFSPHSSLPPATCQQETIRGDHKTWKFYSKKGNWEINCTKLDSGWADWAASVESLRPTETCAVKIVKHMPLIY